MVRLVVILLIGILLITVLRSIIGLLMRGFSDLVRGPNTGPGTPGAARPPVPAGGELKRDPVCGTFVSEAASVQKTVHGEVIHFCSTACRDKFTG